MSKLANQWIELFRAGDYGDKGRFTEADLDHMVRSYDPAFHEAPVVIGHPKDNAPAYGWVEALQRQGSVLLGKLAKVQPAFEEMVQQGLFKKRSISLYATADGPTLRHVGFLGAHPPEIKGLADVQFKNDHEATEVVFEEEMQMAGEAETLFEKFRAFVAGRESVMASAAPTKTFSEDDVKKIVDGAVTTAVQAAVAPLQQQLTQQAATFAEREETLRSEKLGAAASGAVAKLKASGSWVPAFDKMGVPQLFSELAKSTVTIEFAEGDKKENRSLLDTTVAIFSALGKIVPPGTVVQGGKPEAGASFSENPGSTAQVDPNSVRLNALATARAKDKSITFAEALGQVISENPELTVPGGMGAGQV